MVAYYDEYDGVEQPKTLTYWVRNFRLKRMQMRRKMRGSGGLRVNAILSTALLQAEHELRRKQQERFSRWLDIQTKFVPDGKTHCGSDSNYDAKTEAEAAEYERRNVENNLWSSELSGLDSFLSSLSSSNSSIKTTTNNNNVSSNYSSSNNNNQHQCAIAVHS